MKLLRDIAEKDKNVRVLSFSRNFGHQLAVTCGMDNARGEALIIIDADLQDPPELIPQWWRCGSRELISYMASGKNDRERPSSKSLPPPVIIGCCRP